MFNQFNSSSSFTPSHWGMLIASSSLFSELARYVGRRSKFNDTFTTSHAIDKLSQKFGETEQVKRGALAAIKTLKDMQLINELSRNTFTPSLSKIQINPDELHYLLLSIMQQLNVESGELEQLANDPALFPFNISSSMYDRANQFFETYEQQAGTILFIKI
jgi:hypothetical protein